MHTAQRVGTTYVDIEDVMRVRARPFGVAIEVQSVNVRNEGNGGFE